MPVNGTSFAQSIYRMKSSLGKLLVAFSIGLLCGLSSGQARAAICDSVPMSSGVVTTLADNSSAVSYSSPAWSADGNKIVFQAASSSGETAICLYDKNSASAPVSLLLSAGSLAVSKVSQPAFSPVNSNQLTYVTSDLSKNVDSLFIMTSNISSMIDTGSAISAIRFSEDGKKLAWLRDGKVMYYDTTASSPKVQMLASPDSGETLKTPIISVNGSSWTMIYYVADNSGSTESRIMSVVPGGTPAVLTQGDASDANDDIKTLVGYNVHQSTLYFLANAKEGAQRLYSFQTEDAEGQYVTPSDSESRDHVDLIVKAHTTYFVYVRHPSATEDAAYTLIFYNGLAESVLSTFATAVTGVDTAGDGSIAFISQNKVYILNATDTDADGVSDYMQSDIDGDGVSNDKDCNSTDASVHPGAAETCNSIDDNCNGQIDEDLAIVTYYKDSDSDAYGNAAQAVTACAQPQGYVTDNTDCDDSNPNKNLASTCTTTPPSSGSSSDPSIVVSGETAALDADGDGYCSKYVEGCAKWGDCDDYDASVHPSVPDYSTKDQQANSAHVADQIDNNCNSVADEGATFRCIDGSTSCSGSTAPDATDPLPPASSGLNPNARLTGGGCSLIGMDY